MKPLSLELRRLLLVVSLAWTAGCGDHGASNAKPGETSTGGKATPLEESLDCWRAGDQAGAIRRFVEVDWKQKPAAFTLDTPLSRREQELVKMSPADREVLMSKVTPQLRDLKQLAAAVRDQGVAATATNPEFARRCFAKLDECGAALDQPEALKILRLTAQAIRKMGAPGVAQRGK